MDLADVLYIIEGSLEIEELPSPTEEGHRFRATLFDKIHDACVVEIAPSNPDESWKRTATSVNGALRQDALAALAKLMAGNVLGYDLPIQWKSFTHWLRIPPTLVAGNPPVSAPRPKPLPEKCLA